MPERVLNSFAEIASLQTAETQAPVDGRHATARPCVCEVRPSDAFSSCAPTWYTPGGDAQLRGVRQLSKSAACTRATAGILEVGATTS